MPKATYKAIAEQLQLSQATVTLVMKNRPGISEKTRQRVLDAAARAGIYPEPAAAQKQGRIAFLVSGLDSRAAEENPLFAALFSSMNEAVVRNQYDFLIRYVNQGELPAEHFDGVILLASSMTRSGILSFAAGETPVVAVDNSLAYDAVDTVVFDNETGIKKLTEHLVQMGHRRIGYLRGRRELHNFVERYQSFRKAMEEQGLEVRREDVVDAVPELLKLWRQDSGYAQLPTAYLADNDFLALEAQSALRSIGVLVGRDISMAGFDDIPYARLSDPPLCSIRTYHKELGQAAVERLFELIKHSSPPRKYVISTSLQIRESVENQVLQNRQASCL